MGFEDLSARFKKVRETDQAKDAGNAVFDHAESYRLRGKMLGVLIQDARLSAERTLEDCARLLRVPTETIANWEFGSEAPSLPELELLAYYLDVPISHFWGQATMQSKRDKSVDAQREYMALRQRMVGALLRQAREDAQLTLEELANQTYLPQEKLAQYELGEIPVPMNELPVISNAVNKNLSYFMESISYIGELLKIREEWKQFSGMDEEMREFAANPLNMGFIKIAMMYSKMPAEQLRKIAEGLLEITM